MSKWQKQEDHWPPFITLFFWNRPLNPHVRHTFPIPRGKANPYLQRKRCQEESWFTGLPESHSHPFPATVYRNCRIPLACHIPSWLPILHQTENGILRLNCFFGSSLPYEGPRVTLNLSFLLLICLSPIISSFFRLSQGR